MATKIRPAAPTDRRAVSHQLREAIEADERSAYALGKAATVDAGVIQRFLNRERGLTLETVDRLALALRLRLLETGRSRGRPSKPSRPSRDRPSTPEASGVDAPGAGAELDHSGPPEAIPDHESPTLEVLGHAGPADQGDDAEGEDRWQS